MLVTVPTNLQVPGPIQMLALSLLVLLSQAPTSTSEASAERAAAAAERAALAAERAAAAAQLAAEAAGRQALAQGGAPLPPAPVGEVPASDSWKGLVGIGLIAITGNAEALTGTATAQVDKKLGEWGFGARASAAYGQSRAAPGAPAIVSALRAGLLLRGDRNLSSFSSLFALAGLETDHVKSVELRKFAELGTGIRFFERKEGELERVFLRGDVGFRASHETRYQYFGDAVVPSGTPLPDVLLIGPRIAAIFRYALNKDVRVSEEAEMLFNLLGSSRTLFNSTTKLIARLSPALSISGSFLLGFDSAPAPGKQPTDTVLTLGVEAAF